MNWFSIALLCAFFTACSDAFSKRLMNENDEWVTGTLMLGVSSAVLLPVFVAQDLPPLTMEIAAVYGVTLPLEVLGYYLFLSAIRSGPLSLTVPLLAFTPVFTIVTAAIVVREHIPPVGIVGIVLVTAGAYLLNSDRLNVSLLGPVRAVFTNDGSRRMFLCAFVWSLTSTLGKKGVLLCGALPFGIAVVFGDLIVFGTISLLRIRAGTPGFRFDRGNLLLLLVAGIFMVGMEVTHFVALSLAPTAYMISVKRLSLVFGVLIGWMFFGEQNIRFRFVGAAVMVLGVILLHR